MKNLIKSKKFKNFMSKLYGWGASVVIIGALFKIQHYQGAGLMLGVGLGTEALIFFFSAFEPPHVEPDWSLVYPELAGMYTEEDKSDEKKSLTEELDKMLEEAKIGPELISSLGVGLNKLNETTSKLSDVSDATVATNDYVQNIKGASKSAGELTNSYNKTAEVLLNDANVSSQYQTSVKAVSQSANELAGSYNKAAEILKSDLGASQEYVNSIKSATKSANDLTEQYSKSAESLTKLSNVSDAAVATNDYVQNIKGASKSAGELTNSYNKAAEVLSNDANVSSQFQTSIKAVSQSANELAGSYNQAVEIFKSDLGASLEYVNSLKSATKSANDLTEQYSKSAELLTKSAQALDFSAVDSKAYGDQIQKVAQNLSALNSVYELQLKGTSEQLQATNKLQETLNQFMGNLSESSENTMKFKSEIATLNKNLSALNNVYGNMLAAMNVNVNR